MGTGSVDRIARAIFAITVSTRDTVDWCSRICWQIKGKDKEYFIAAVELKKVTFLHDCILNDSVSKPMTRVVPVPYSCCGYQETTYFRCSLA